MERKIIPQESKNAKELRILIDTGLILIDEIVNNYEMMKNSSIKHAEKLEGLMHNEIGECEVF